MNENHLLNRAIALSEKTLEAVMTLTGEVGKLGVKVESLEKVSEKADSRLLNLEQSNRLLDKAIEKESRDNKDFQDEQRKDFDSFRAEQRQLVASEQATHAEHRATWEKRWVGNGDPGISRVVEKHKTWNNLVAKAKEKLWISIIAMALGGTSIMVGVYNVVDFFRQPAKVAEENKTQQSQLDSQQQQIDKLIRSQETQQQQINQLIELNRKREEAEERARIRNARNRRRRTAQAEPVLAMRRDHLASGKIPELTISGKDYAPYEAKARE